ncbi:hypothetical protein [Kitasatospora sp. NPDC101183]|uniref:hypothetical protein n=1 Tax=Kitasatospora sp. NPDC101183 TaxID=3364100 RepID=UPI0037FAFB82
MTDHFPYRIVTGRGDMTLLWRHGEGDDPADLAVDEAGRLLAFEELRPMQDLCDRRGWKLVHEGGATLNLAPVRRWVEQPGPGPVHPGLLLEAWNFFDDLFHTLRSRTAVPAQGPLHDNAYVKLFDGEDAWTPEEESAVRTILRAGLSLWDRESQDRR